MAAPVYSTRCEIWVAKWGTDDAGYNGVGSPMAKLTIAGALADLAANYPTATALAPHTITIEPGTYTTPAFALPPFTFIKDDPDGAGLSAPATVISLTGNVTLAAGWSVNQTAIGGFIGVNFQQSSAQIIDLTLPTPASGNPSRTLYLIKCRTNVDSLSYEATSTADAIQVSDLIHFGNSGDSMEFSAGSITVIGMRSSCPVTFNDTAAIAAAANIGGLYMNAAPSATTPGVTFLTTTGGLTARMGFCDNRALTLNRSGAAAITVYADAVSIPLVANITFSGTATNADLIRTTDSGGIAGGTSNDYVAVTNNTGDTTITPDAHNYQVNLTITGAARTSNIALSTAGAPAPVVGDVILVALTLPATAAIILNFRNATAAGTVLQVLTTDAILLSGRCAFVYTGTAWIFTPGGSTLIGDGTNGTVTLKAQGIGGIILDAITGGVTASGGAVGSGGLMFSLDPNARIYQDAGATFRFAINNSRVMSIVSTGIQLSTQAAQTAGAPGIAIDSAATTGLFCPGAGRIGFTNGGNQTAELTSATIATGAFTVLYTTAAVSAVTGSLIIGAGGAATQIGLGAGAIYAGAGYFNVANARINTLTATYGLGTAYSLTNTSAAIVLGTTSPTITIPSTGSYRFSGQVQLVFNAATFAANQTVTLKIRRTNNTPADLANGTTTLTAPIITALSYTWGLFRLNEITLTATAGDIVTIFADVATVPGAGSLDAVASGTYMCATLAQ